MRLRQAHIHLLGILASLQLLLYGGALEAQAQAQGEAQSRVVQYRQGEADFSDTDIDNPAEIARFVELYRLLGRNDTITITSSASPEGSGKWLRPLAERRGEHLRRQLLAAGLPEELIVYGRRDIDWPMLRDYVAENAASVPGADDVLAVFTVAASPYNTIALRQAIKKVEGGRAWRYLYATMFPAMRYARAEFPGMYVEPRKPLEVIDISPIFPEPARASAGEIVEVELPAAACTPRYWALKTNLLHDLLLVPNIAIEWAFKPRWTIGADYSGAWWGNKYRTHLWRYYGGNLDLRYYFGSLARQKPLQGWHVGVYGEFASYDFQFGLDGFQGKRAWGTGATIGYMLPISRHFNLDFTLGVGFFGGRYKRCRYMDGCEVWTGTYFRRWYGPTRGEISLTWLLGCGNVNPRKRKGGAL